MREVFEEKRDCARDEHLTNSDTNIPKNEIKIKQSDNPVTEATESVDKTLHINWLEDVSINNEWFIWPKIDNIDDVFHTL